MAEKNMQPGVPTLTEEEKAKKRTETLQTMIQDIKDKKFKICFFVIDTKGNPSDQLVYIYKMVKTLKDMGYDAQILYQEKDEFIGVKDWMGEEYANLPHFDTKKNFEIAAKDILVIPEGMPNVMSQVRNLPCRKVVLVQNYSNIYEMLPFGVSWRSMGFFDMIATSQKQANMVLDVFPYLNNRAHVIHPVLNEKCNFDAEKKPVINIIAREQFDIARIVKPFYLKYPQYKWISFRDLRTITTDVYASSLSDAAFTIWCDTQSDYGIPVLDAMKAGSVVLAKVPDVMPEWGEINGEHGKELRSSVLWFQSITDLPNIICNCMNSWLTDKLPENIYKEMKNTVKDMTQDNFQKEIEDTFISGFAKETLDNFETILKNDAKNVSDELATDVAAAPVENKETKE